ncbi:MAG: DNA polymerase III subunit alpha [Anaerostipes sp.]|nr:DNA polymerase III subunit alpha [Anaerostipes sp.]
MEFTHLHVHTEYSLLDGSSKIKEIVHQAKELGMDSLAITDHGVMYGVIDFYKAAKAEGIKPIIGCEVYVTTESRFVKETRQGESRYYHLVLLAENNTGYHNLMKIVSRGFTEGFYYRPRVDYEVLEKYKEGIIALSACLAGEIPSYILEDDYEKAKETALNFEKLFGKDNFFLELQDHGISEQMKVNSAIVKLSKETGIDMVATNDVHYTYAEDAEAHDILLCIQTGKKVADEERMRYEGGQYYLKSAKEMERLFPYASEAIENTHKIAQRCEVDIVFGEQKVPKFDVPEGFTSVTYLRKLCEEGINRRYDSVTQNLRERLEFELSTIEHMGYVDYFLIVWDFIRYAKEQGIAVGPGRGSAAGSIVSYCLEITNIDPIQYQLLFERFLNPERVSMPDIDIDFCYERRQEVIDYVVEKYGKEQVVQIITFGTMSARMVIRDVGRALDIPYAKVDSIAKMVPNELNITLKHALKISSDLKKIYEEDEESKYLLDMSMRLEGLPRHSSMHAAGVVIGKEAIDEFVPLAKGSEDAVTTQFTMTTIEELGLLKMDFLGLRTLTVIQDAVNLINKRLEKPLDIETIPMNDTKVFHMIGEGKTEGVFQLESSGMKSFMKELKPESLEEIIAGISLYRPGPMDFIPRYIKGKNDKETIAYDCSQLEEILAPTYGCIVYQEQVMQIVMELAGYTLGRSDLVRRAMSKKKGEVMKQERQNFVYGNEKEGVLGCINNGIDEKTANHIWDEMMDFAKYAFNKSHAAAYAVVSYETAYLKYYYPKEFMAALMTSVLDHTEKVAAYVYECRKMGIKVLPPDINLGEGSFSVDNGNIRYGLSAIKSLGKPVIEAIIKERNLNGPYKSLSDLVERLSSKEMNKRTVESMIKSGALDSLGYTRKQQMFVYASVLDGIQKQRKSEISGQMSLLDFMTEDQQKDFEITYPDVGEYEKNQKLLLEKEVLGIYASGHPLEDDAQMIEKVSSVSTVDFLLDDEVESHVVDGETCTIGGIISDITIKLTRRNENMAFITLEDMRGTVEVIVFPRQYQACQSILQADQKVFIRGTAQISEEESKIICNQITTFDDMIQEIWVQFDSKNVFFEEQNKLYELLKMHRGKNRVIIYCKEEKAINRLGNGFGASSDQDLIYQLQENFGKKNIKIKKIGI